MGNLISMVVVVLLQEKGWVEMYKDSKYDK